MYESVSCGGRRGGREEGFQQIQGRSLWKTGDPPRPLTPPDISVLRLGLRLGYQPQDYSSSSGAQWPLVSLSWTEPGRFPGQLGCQWGSQGSSPGWATGSTTLLARSFPTQASQKGQSFSSRPLCCPPVLSGDPITLWKGGPCSPEAGPALRVPQPQ